MDGQTFNTAINRFHTGAGMVRRQDGTPQWNGPSGRRDSGQGAVLNLAAYRERINARRIDQALRSIHPDGRLDNFSANAGFHLARDLEYIHTEVLQEEFPLQNAMRLFDVDESVPVGANTHTVRRQYQHGEARVYRGRGSHVPRVGLQQREESWPIRHLVCGYGWDIFEAASSQFANSGLIQGLARVARDAILELANRIWWGLDNVGQVHGLYGVLDYPWLPKKDIATGFSRATVEANPDTILGELHDLVNFPHQTSKSVFQPNVLVMTNRVHDVLSSVRFASGSDTTILQHFLANSAHIQRVEIAWELEDAGGAGVDGILAYRRDQRGIQIVMPQGVTQLPIQVQGLESEVINYASIGGAVMKDVLNNVLGYADTNA
jgi:hypothetical protein